jgi:hypothetical protein
MCSAHSDIPFVRRLFVDYRHFDAKDITPRYEFGFGLSYTTFEFSDLSISAVEGGQDQDEQLEANWAAGKPGPQVVGASTALWLHRAAFSVSFTVRNTGSVVGTEVRYLLKPVFLGGQQIDGGNVPDTPGVLALPCARG